MKKILSILLMTILATAVLAGCGTSGEEKKTLVMGTSADYKPFEYIDTAKGSEIIGLDIDLVNYIVDELGYELEIKDMSFDGLIGALQAEQVDFVAASMSATEERKQNVDFSITYYQSGEMLITTKDSGISKVEDLAGKTVGVQLGSIQEDTAEELATTISDLKIQKLNKIPEIIQELKTGRIDAVVMDQSISGGYMEENEELTGFLLSEDAAGTAIAFPKGSELVEPFNKVLQEMKDNGKLDEIINKWLAGQE